jgi:hypothetical protein
MKSKIYLCCFLFFAFSLPCWGQVKELKLPSSGVYSNLLEFSGDTINIFRIINKLEFGLDFLQINTPVIFHRSNFKNIANFRRLTFQNKVDFNSSTFQNKADFSNSSFNYYTSFHDSRGNNKIIFTNAQMPNILVFSSIDSLKVDFRDVRIDLLQKREFAMQLPDYFSSIDDSDASMWRQINVSSNSEVQI